MRSHGWDGEVPEDDAEARRRILDATRRVVAEKGVNARLADVARVVGVTRQTVYRYFPGTEALLVATAEEAIGVFLERIAARLRGITDPVQFVVEGIAFVIEELPKEPAVEVLLEPRNVAALAAGIPSDLAVSYGRRLLVEGDVDWAAAGVDEAGIGELTEAMLRSVQSFVISPGRPARDGEDLRRYLRRWVVPAVLG